MSCDICGRGACANWMHSEEEQKQYENVIDAFNHARALRDEVRGQIEATETGDE